MTTPRSWRPPEYRRIAHALSVVVLLGLTGCALPKSPVAVNALVEPSYIRPADADGRPLPQTYVFVPGRHFTGLMRYSVLDQVKLSDLLPSLAEALRQQNYVPAPDPNQADLLIVVHWGVVDVLGEVVPLQERYDELNQRTGEFLTVMQNSTIGDAGALNETLRDLRTDAVARDVDMKQVAGLLGYTLSLARASKQPFSSAEEDSMRADLSESRYLVILAAYEREPANGGKRRRMWITRLSLRAPGRNFTEAFPALVAAGRQVFGRETDGILRVQPGASVPRVRLGELTVLESIPDGSMEETAETGTP